jgi:hypothetical protein
MMEGLASEGTNQKTVVIDLAYLKVHRIAFSLWVNKRYLRIRAGA